MDSSRVIYGGSAAAAVVGGVAVAEGRLPIVLAGIALLVGLLVLLPRIVTNPERFLLAGLALGVALAPADGLRIGTLTDSDIVIALFGSALLVTTAYTGQLSRLPLPMTVGAGLLAISALLVVIFPPDALSTSIFQSQNLQTNQLYTAGNLALAGQLVVAVFVFPSILGLIGGSVRRASRLLINAWLAGVAASSLVGLLAAFTPLDLQTTLTGATYATQTYEDVDGRFTGLSVHPTLFGLAAVFALPIVLARIVDARSAARNLPLVGVYVLAILVSGSRATVVGMLLVFLLIFAWQYRSRGPLVLITSAGVLLAYASGKATSTLSSLQRLVGGGPVAGGVTTSDVGHASAVSQGIHFFLERPVVGFGYQGIRGAHSVPLELLNSGGVLALIGFSLIIAAVLALAWRVKPLLPERDQLDLLGLIGAVGAFIVTGLVTNASIDRFLYVPLGLLLGLALSVGVAPAAERIRPSAAPPTRPGRLRPAASEWTVA